MGTLIEKHMIVNVWESDWENKPTEKKIDKYIKKIKEEYRNLFGKFHSVTNGYLFYFVAWDGSKEGWDVQQEAKEIRENFVKFVKEISLNSTILFIKENVYEENEPDYNIWEIDKREWTDEHDANDEGGEQDE